MNTRQLAKILGRRGGRARAKSLSGEEKRKIASLGGKSRAKSLQAARHVRENFRYLETIQVLGARNRKIKRLKNFKGRLPGIYV